MDIAGKVFIVTGGASGLGEGTARMLAKHGGKVVIADLQADKGEAVARELGGAFVKCDVSQEADGQAAVAAALKLGKLMGLVNCAGIAPAAKTVGKDGAHALALHLRFALLLDGAVDEVADDRVDLLADVADLGELGRLDLDEWRVGGPR